MYKFLLISIMLFINLVFFSQDYTPVRPNIIDSSKPNKSKNKTIEENAVTKTFIVKNEEYYSDFIKALEGKKAYLKADSALNKKAINLNWYARIDKELKKAKLELSKIKTNEK